MNFTVCKLKNLKKHGFHFFASLKNLKKHEFLFISMALVVICDDIVTCTWNICMSESAKDSKLSVPSRLACFIVWLRFTFGFGLGDITMEHLTKTPSHEFHFLQA